MTDTLWRPTITPTATYARPVRDRSVTDATWRVLATYEVEPDSNPDVLNWWVAAVIDVTVDPGAVGEVRIRMGSGPISIPAAINSYVERVRLGWLSIDAVPSVIHVEGRRTQGPGGLRLLAAGVTLMSLPPAGERGGPGYPPGYTPPGGEPYPPTYTTEYPYGPPGNAFGAPIITYDDPYTAAIVHRLTRDGADNQVVNYMGNESGESICWSPDSTRLVIAKYKGPGSAINGIYVFDMAAGRWAAVCSTDTQWSYPIFNHDGTKIVFIKGAGGTPDGGGNKPFAVYTCPVPTTLDYNTGPVDTATLVLDVRAGSLAGGGAGVGELRILTKNRATNPADQLFSVHHERPGGGFRTLIFSPAGTLKTGWGFGTDNDWNTAFGDGDASIWSPTDPNVIFTNRATGPGNNAFVRAVWDVTTRTQIYSPTTVGGGVEVAHSDWIYHPATGTHLHMGAFRTPFSRVGTVNTDHSSKGIFHGELHFNFDQASAAGPLSAVRGVADEYNSGSGSEGHLYVVSAGDYGIGATSPFAGSFIWPDIRANRRRAGHRNPLGDGSNPNLAAYQPHPQFSPDGQWILWQSECLNFQATPAGLTSGYTYPSGTCGPAGGNNGSTSFMDILITRSG